MDGCAEAVVGPDWIDAEPDYVGELIEHKHPREPWFESLLDFKLLAFVVETAQLLAHRQQKQ